MKKRRSRKNSLPLMKKLAWNEFSEYLRRKNADFYGVCECITCGFKAHWKEMQAGHFIHGKFDFDEMNVNVQCARCNKYLHGNLGFYALKLITKHGKEKIEDLQARAKKTAYEKLSRLDFEELYNKYKALNG